MTGSFEFHQDYSPPTQDVQAVNLVVYHKQR